MYIPTKTGHLQKIDEREIRTVCLRAREILLEQPMLLELEAPLKICGNSALTQGISTVSTMIC